MNVKKHSLFCNYYKQVEMQFDEDGQLIPFEGQPVYTISYDEKLGIQALSTTTPDKQPIKDNSVIMRDYEYVRKGTL